MIFSLGERTVSISPILLVSPLASLFLKMHRYPPTILLALCSIAYIPATILAADLGPNSADLWNVLQCIPYPWTPQGTNPAEEIFLKGLTQPNFREVPFMHSTTSEGNPAMTRTTKADHPPQWTVSGGGWTLEALKKASEETAMSCKVGPDGIERPSNSNAAPNADQNQLQHPSAYKIDSSTPAYQKYLRDLANIAYSMACFHGPYKHDPGFSQKCKSQVAQFYGQTPVRLKRGQIENLFGSICQSRQVLESSRTPRPAAMNNKDGADFWRFIRARHCRAEQSLANWLQDEWLPREGDEQARNARWSWNRRYEEPLPEEGRDAGRESGREREEKKGPLQFMMQLWEEVKRAPNAPWNRGVGGRGGVTPGTGMGTPRRVPMRRPFKA